jgi:hypothetical protein
MTKYLFKKKYKVSICEENRKVQNLFRLPQSALKGNRPSPTLFQTEKSLPTDQTANTKLLRFWVYTYNFVTAGKGKKPQ